MKTEKKLQEYCENLPLPEKDKILSAVGADEKKIIRTRKKKTARRAVIILAAALVLCVIMVGGVIAASVAVVMHILPNIDIPSHELGKPEIDIGQENENDMGAVSGSFYLTAFAGENKLQAVSIGKVDGQTKTDWLAHQLMLLGVAYDVIPLHEERVLISEEKHEISTEYGEAVETYTPAVYARNIYFEGTAITDELTLKILVNSAIDNSGVRYCKLFFNDVPAIIGGEMPEHGYARFDLSEYYETTPGYNPGGEIAEQGQSTNIKIKVVDQNGDPVPNVSVRLEYVSGPEGSYMPGYATTSMRKGCVVSRKGVIGATYNICAEVMTNGIVYGDLPTRPIYSQIMKITATGDDEVTMVWYYRDAMVNSPKKSVTLLDEQGSSMSDIWISMHTMDGENQIVLGYTDEAGKVYYYGDLDGEYQLVAMRFIDDNDNSDWSATFNITIANGGDVTVQAGKNEAPPMMWEE